MKPADVNSNTYFVFNEENNKKDSKLEVGYYVRISKYKNIFEKGYVPNCSEEIFVIKRVKITVMWTHVVRDEEKEKGEEKELQIINQKEFRVIKRKVIKRKRDKLYVKWKVYKTSFNSCIDKKDMINE